MSFESTARVHKDVMTAVANLLHLEELPVEQGATVIFSPRDVACDFALVRWTADDDYLSITLDPDALTMYIQRLQTNLERLRQDRNSCRRPGRAAKLQAKITDLELVLSAFEAAQREASP